MAVAITLRVGDTSAYDIPLTSSGVMVEDFPLNAPDVNQQPIQNLGDGNSLSIPTWSNVTESYQLHISDTTAALVAAKVQGIERLLTLARQGTVGWLDDKLYLRIQFDQDSLAWRSQILAAKLDLPNGTDQIWRKYVKATLIVTRRYYWETEALQDLQATSGPTTTPTTGYVTVYNADDTHATNRNWWQIAAAQVQGSIPAPATITIKNNSGGTRAASTFYIGNYVFCDPANVDPVFRVESATGTDSSVDTTDTDIAYWDISALPDDFRGQPGRILVVWNSRPDPTTLVRAALQYRPPTPVVDLALGEQVLSPAADYVLDLGALPIPPGRAWASMGTYLYLTLKGLAASGTDTVTVDWMQVMPSGQGRFRMLKGIFASLALGDQNALVDDGAGDGVYLYVDSSGAHLPAYQPFYDPIYLWPNRINRLRFIVSGGTSFEADQVWQVKTSMRFRRLTF